MYRCPPVLSPILAAKERIRQDKIMKNRLKNVGKSVDNTCPKSYASGWNRRPNPKKQQLINDRKALIQQDNRLLLERISDIMQHNHLDQHAGTRKYTDRMSNIGGRRAQLKIINKTNKIILGRLKKTTAYYDNRVAAKDWKMYRHHLEHMGTYAYKGGGVMNGSVQKILAGAGKSKRSPNSKKKVIKRASTAGHRRRHRQKQSKKNLNNSGPLSKSIRHSISAGQMGDYGFQGNKIERTSAGATAAITPLNVQTPPLTTEVTAKQKRAKESEMLGLVAKTELVSI